MSRSAGTLLLLVEDNPITRKMMRFALAGAGWTVLEAGDGRTALELAANQLPDIVIQDYVLPDTDGLELLGRLRALPGGAQIPALVVTGMVSRLDELRARGVPNTTFLGKPIEPSRLLEIVGVIGQPRARSAGRLRRVLVVDDEPLNRKLAAFRLRDAGFEVDTAEGGEEALRKAHLSVPDAILSDVLMPKMDGFQLSRTVGHDGQLARVPVVLLSSTYIDDADRSLALAMGARALVTRSPHMREALDALEEALEDEKPSAMAASSDALDALHAERVQVQLEEQVSRNEALVRQASIQAAALSVVRGLAESFSRPESAPRVLGDVLVHCLDAAGLSVGLLYVVSADGALRLQAQVGLPSEARSAAASCFGHPETVRRALAAGEPLACGLEASGPQDTGMIEFAKHFAGGRALVTPFIVLGEPYGALVLASDVQNLSEPSWVIFARSLAGQFGQTLALARSLYRGAVTEARYQTLMEQANDAILILEPEYRILEANLRAETLLGRPRGEIVGHSYDEFVVAGERDDVIARRAQLVAEGKIHLERALLRADGSTLSVDVSASVAWIGEEVVVLMILRDVSARNRAAAELRERTRLAEYTAEVSAALVHEEELASVLRRCCEATVRHLECAFARVWTLNDGEDTLELQASAGMFTHLDGPHSRVPVGHLKIGRIAAERKPHITNSVIDDPRIGDQELARQEGMVAFAGYPLVVGERLVGVVAMFARTTLSDAVLQALASVADQIALVIQRKREEAALRASEEHTRWVVGANPAVIYALRLGADMSLTPTWVSENMERLLGYSARDASSFEWWAANIHPDDRDRVLSRMRTMVSETDQRTHEYRMRHANGEYCWIRDEQRVLRDANGTPSEIVGSWSDISEHKTAEASLETSDAQYRVVFDDSPSPMWIFDEETLRILAVNDAATRVYGWSGNEFLEMTVLDIRPPGEAPKTGIGAGNDRGSAELRALRRSTHLRKDGSRVEVEEGRSPMRFHGRDASLVFVTALEA